MADNGILALFIVRCRPTQKIEISCLLSFNSPLQCAQMDLTHKIRDYMHFNRTQL
jgi:hypothetical protein